MHPWLWNLATQPQKQEASQWLRLSFSNISQAQDLPQPFIHSLFSHHRHGSILALLGLSTMKPGPCLPSKQSWVMRSLPSVILTFSQACAWSCLTLCNPLDCSPWGPCGRGISQARILECVAISYSRESSWPRDQTHISYIGRQVLFFFFLADRFFTTMPPGKPIQENSTYKYFIARLLAILWFITCWKESCIYW